MNDCSNFPAFSATYSPEDNKIRLSTASRLPPELYARVKAAGFSWAPKQEIFVAPMWTPEREDLALELAGEIEAEETTAEERAADRAARFEGYSDRRGSEAAAAHRAVERITSAIPMGQPILVGHHSERHARKDAERIENGMRKAVNLWETSKYWEQRARAARRHADYLARPDVRARRIKGIEADLRKLDRADKESAETLQRWALVDKPEAWKPNAAGEIPNREQRAYYIAGRGNFYGVAPSPYGPLGWSAYDVLRPDDEGRSPNAPRMTVDEITAAIHANEKRAAERRARWREHYTNRLAYERAMLADAGGTVADRKGPEKGGAVRCWCSPGYGKGWSYVQRVNKVSVSVLDNYGNGRGNFARTIPFDKLAQIMTAAEVSEARGAGLIAETSDKTGFFLRAAPDNSPAETREESRQRAHVEAVQAVAQPGPQAADFAAMRETLRAGVQVVAAPQLFPTPAALAARVVQLAGVTPGARVLEPSAGTGRLVGALGGFPFGHDPERGAVVAVEINRSLCDRLRAEFPLTRVVCADFLSIEGPHAIAAGLAPLGLFDVVVMNPPFQDAADIRHIQHAARFLAPGGRLVAICANGPRQNAQLKPWAEASGGTWEALPAGSFEESGTGVNAALLVYEAPEARTTEAREESEQASLF